MDKVFCGIDWAEQHHDVAVVDQDGKLIAKKRIHDTLQGWQQLLDLLAAAGDNAQAPIPVAIETPRGLLVAALRATGRPVYAINPMAVARYRDRHTVARSKSDHADALVLANILRTARGERLNERQSGGDQEELAERYRRLDDEYALEAVYLAGELGLVASTVGRILARHGVPAQ